MSKFQHENVQNIKWPMKQIKHWKVVRLLCGNGMVHGIWYGGLRYSVHDCIKEGCKVCY